MVFKNNWWNANPMQIIDASLEAPLDESNVEAQKGDIVILYKFACEDCESIYQELNDVLDENNVDPIWVSSASVQGQKFVADYEIKTVPTIIYVLNNKYADNDIEQRNLVTNEGTLNIDNLNELIGLQKNQI